MRRKDREVTDLAEIMRIVGAAKVLHLGLVDEGSPYIVPLHYGYSFSSDNLIFYLHSAKEGRKLDILKKNPSVCVELETDVSLIPGEIACSYGSSFASLIGWGKAELVTSMEEKAEGLTLLMENQTGKRFSFTEEMVSPVAVIKVTIDHFSVKERPMPGRRG